VYTSVCLLPLLGIIITYSAAPYIFKSFTDQSIYTTTIEFLKIRIWGLPFLYLYQMRNGLLVGTNQSKLLVYGTLAETITNIVLDYGLIFGNLGLPKLGFKWSSLCKYCRRVFGNGCCIHGHWDQGHV